MGRQRSNKGCYEGYCDSFCDGFCYEREAFHGMSLLCGVLEGISMGFLCVVLSVCHNFLAGTALRTKTRTL